MQKIILNWIIKIPLWAHEINLRVMSVSLIKNISNQSLRLTFWRKIMMTVFSYGNNRKNPLFRQASQIFRIAAHPLRPHANRLIFHKSGKNGAAADVHQMSSLQQVKWKLKFFLCMPSQVAIQPLQSVLGTYSRIQVHCKQQPISSIMPKALQRIFLSRMQGSPHLVWCTHRKNIC